MPTAQTTKRQARTFRQRQELYAQSRSKQEMAELTPGFVNYDYSNWREIWRSIRHAMIGEIAIKQQGKIYLPQPEGMDDGQYAAYLDRAVFYNMVYRTVTGLTGAIFRRDPRVINPGPKLKALLPRISKDGLSMAIFSKVIAQDMLSTGRFGVLADKPNTNDLLSRPYLAGYTAENILDWTTTDIDGRDEYDYILLREFRVDRRLVTFEGTTSYANPTYGQLFNAYRVLRLIWDDYEGKWAYHQEFYARDAADADMTEDPYITIPLVYGVPMNRIPFRFFNATTNLPDIEKPPILDILTLNMSHYKTYAQLEHGRFYTANPVYYVSGAQEDDEYHIGPSVVWEIGNSEKAGIIEFTGTGMKSLESALETKENQVASLGGRLIGDSGSAGQSDNQIKLKDRNEQSLLLNVTTVMNENFTYLLTVLSNWMNESAEDLVYRVNQDFLLDGAAAREFRAISMMYQDGTLPIEIFYEYFLKADVIPEYVTLEMFRDMLEDDAQFPNNPDIAAKRKGFPNAQAEVTDAMQRDALEEDGRQSDDDNDTKLEIAELARTSAEKIAKQTPKIAPVPATAVQANVKDPAPKPVAKVVAK
jgi:hypothetical protein